MTWTRETSAPKGKPYHAIHCFDCKIDVPTRAHLRHHMGHAVHYVDKNGAIDE